MNYSTMRRDILELFLEAQAPTQERLWRINAKRQAEFLEARHSYEQEEYYRHKALYRHRGLWAKNPPPRAKVGVSQCPLCGGALEHREGFAPNRAPVHVGICSR